jgi:DNA-binding CsgD family transcriptional regulator
VPTMTSTPRIPSHRPATQSHLLERLDAEWAHLRTSRRALRTARAWALRYPDHPLADVVSELVDLEQLRRATQRTNRPERGDDAILLALVELSHTDELAGRIVLQHLLPALIVHAQRYRSFQDRTDPIAQVVPAAWLAIRTYDVDRRRHHVASSLVSDAVFQAFRRPLRARSATEKVVAPDDFASSPSPDGPGDALVEFVTVLRDAQGAGVAAVELDLLRQLVRVGSPRIVAEQRNVTPRTIRNHRDRAIDHVRRAVAVAVAA